VEQALELREKRVYDDTARGAETPGHVALRVRRSSSQAYGSLGKESSAPQEMPLAVSNTIPYNSLYSARYLVGIEDETDLYDIEAFL
jgi:hypothetical protein